ncbi:hypothetical protein B0J12DRAFT_26191 [Macrophomina phaseolina]|uniref:Uncharacterized protein n=1 Tax=Macrophomina phaseolina TaxID=35725 RepID=A0ABQ8GV62_9PEZI|nr:hypothetical protein B0J12DRAFT_26191 [Macrophomina phaseolina]
MIFSVVLLNIPLFSCLSLTLTLRLSSSLPLGFRIIPSFGETLSLLFRCFPSWQGVFRCETGFGLRFPSFFKIWWGKWGLEGLFNKVWTVFSWCVLTEGGHSEEKNLLSEGKRLESKEKEKHALIREGEQCLYAPFCFFVLWKPCAQMISHPVAVGSSLESFFFLCIFHVIWLSFCFSGNTRFCLSVVSSAFGRSSLVFSLVWSFEHLCALFPLCWNFLF